MKAKWILSLFLIGIFNQLLAQEESASAKTPGDCASGWENGWCWGDDPGAAKERNVLYSDAIKMKDWERVQEPLEWLLENTPNLNKSIYINGIKFYSHMLDKATEAKDQASIDKYEDRILELHDLRIKYFGQEADVLARKGLKAYVYLNDREDTDQKELFDLYNRILELNGNETNRTNLTILMVTAVYSKVKKKITEEEILGVYDRLSEVLEFNIQKATGANKQKWVQTQDKIDGLLPKAVNIDCDFVREKLGDDLKANPDDMKLTKRAMKYMLQGKCTDDPLFLVAAENLYAKEPTGGLAETIATRYQINEDQATAIEWKMKAIDLYTEEPAKQAELYMDLARFSTKDGKYSDARAKAMKAVEMDASLAGDAYSLIGDLYMNSFKQCSTSNPVESRAVFLAAYDAYAKAGNSSKMASAKAQFPSKEEIFLQNIELGSSMSVGCWIGRSTSVRTRD